MEEKTCSAFNASNYQGDDAARGDDEVNDRLMELLNDDILLSILSLFTTKEIVRSCLVSKKWKNRLLGRFPRLIFEDSLAMTTIRHNYSKVFEERTKFVRWVDHVVDQHRGATIDEFKIIFDLNDSFQSHIDKWVDFAIAKRAKIFELQLSSSGPLYREEEHYYTFPFEHCKPIGLKHAIVSLCLTFVNVSAEVIENLFISCPFLENLRIEYAPYLAGIRASSSSLMLRHLTVSRCKKMQFIDISTPKLMSFTYLGPPIMMDIRDASSLSKLSVGAFFGGIAFAFSLAKYFSQLEYLCLKMPDQYNLGNCLHLPALSKLKYLEVFVSFDYGQNFIKWIPLLEACPLLEKLRFKFIGLGYKSIFEREIVNQSGRQIVNQSGRRFKCLKTLELDSYCGRGFDQEIAIYVLENSIKLEYVFVAFRTPYTREVDDRLECAERLKAKLPQESIAGTPMDDADAIQNAAQAANRNFQR